MARLFIVSYQFPPTRLVSSKRMGHFFMEAKSFFDDIYVLTSEKNAAFETDSLLDFPIEHREWISHRDFRSDLQQRSGSPSRLVRRLKQHSIGQKLLQLRKRWPLFYWFGDGGRDYIHKAVKRADAMIRKHQITHLFTSYGPYADLIIGYKLKKRHPHLTWISDFRDIFENKPSLDPQLRNPFWYMGRKVKIADLVTTVSEGLAQPLRLLHPRVSVLYNGIGKFSQHPEIGLRQAAFTISYTGTLYDRWQALGVFFQLLSQSPSRFGHFDEGEHIQFRYFGPDAIECQSKAQNFNVDAFCTMHASTSMTQALLHQKESHINLLLSWSHARQKGVLNAKLFEYLGAQRPIFAIVTGPLDEELRYWVETVGKGRCFFTEKHSLSEMSAGLNSLMESIHSGRWKAPTKLPSEMFWAHQAPIFWNRILNEEQL